MAKLLHMNSHKVDTKISLLEKGLVAIGTGTLEWFQSLDRLCCLFLLLENLLVHGIHMKVKKTLLKKLLGAKLTRMGTIILMLLQMIMHRALILLDSLAMRADEMTLLITNILEYHCGLVCVTYEK